MINEKLSKQIEEKALEYGYDSCGIIPVNNMDGMKNYLTERLKKVPASTPMYAYLDLAGIKRRFPWARSVVICLFDFSRYKFPEQLQGKYAKGYLLIPECNTDSEIYRQTIEFEKWLDLKGIRWEGGDHLWHKSIGSLRYAAESAGLGIIRKNNFLYNENGSNIMLVGYAIDRECELYHEHNMRPCAESCTICQNACPTGALCGPNTMNPLKCVSCLNTFGKGMLLPGMKSEQMQEWVIGCDSCQDACPYNRKHDWSKGEEISTLTAIADKLLPENVMNADDEFIKNEVIPRSFEHLGKNKLDVDTVRRCAKRSVKNHKLQRKK